MTTIDHDLGERVYGPAGARTLLDPTSGPLRIFRAPSLPLGTIVRAVDPGLLLIGTHRTRQERLTVAVRNEARRIARETLSPALLAWLGGLDVLELTDLVCDPEQILQALRCEPVAPSETLGDVLGEWWP